MSDWISICKQDDIMEGAGVCALHQGEQVAIFKVSGQQLFAVSNYDPIGEANVLSRGLVGSIKDIVVVASPLYKQHFCLKTGVCLEDDSKKLKTYRVRSQGEDIQLQM